MRGVIGNGTTAETKPGARRSGVFVSVGVSMNERKVAEGRRAERGERNKEARHEAGEGLGGLPGAKACEFGRVAQEEMVDIVLERRRETRTVVRTVGVGSSGSAGRVCEGG